MLNIKQIAELIAQDKVEEAFDKLKNQTSEKPNFPADLSAQIQMLSGRYNDVKRKERIGVIRFDDASTAHAQIRFSLLELLAEIKKNMPEKKVFISYNHHDAEVANQLKEKLVQSGLKVIIDSESMLAGQDIKEFIQQSVAATDATVSVVSKNSLLSSWVGMETVNTFYHQQTMEGKKFIACFVENGFLSHSFTEEALQTISSQLKEIEAARTQRMTEGHDTRDLNNEYTRLKELSNNFDGIIAHLRESLCIDIAGRNLTDNYEKILKAIQDNPT